MPTVREYEQVLLKDPAHTEAFLALRKSYREAGKFDKLVTLYECRAQAIDDQPKAAELFYLAAEVRVDHLQDVEGAETDLAHAVDRDPNNLKATKRLKDMYREQGRTPEYMTMLEMEAAAVVRTKDPARLAELQTEMSQFSTLHLARLEKALANPATKGEVTDDQLKLIESARKIHRALGDYESVVRLYDLELAATTDAKRRADLLLGFGRVLGEKIGDLQGAAQRLGEVVRLRPRDDRALEALAAVYAHPKWIGADGTERAAALYHQVARRRHEAGDTDNAIAALRKALTAVSGHSEASDLLERVLYDAARMQDLDRYYRERVAGARSNEERMDFLFKRAQLAEGDLGDAGEALRVYEEIVSIEPPGGPASQHLGELYLASQDYGKLAELRERQLDAATDPAFRLVLLTELSSLYRDRLGDAEQAAVYLHAILQIDPGNSEALQAYADHFRQRGDWRELADLLEFAFDHAQSAGAAATELLPRLEEIAVISEGKLGDVERALGAWQKMEQLSPGYERAREAQKRILLKNKQWDRMVSVLEREYEVAAEQTQKVEILRRLARVYIEKLNAPDRAAGVYQQILALDPRDMVALRALVDSYERGERYQELAKLLRDQLEVAASKQEKVGLLRRLLGIYDERLSDLAEASWSAAEILKLMPGDRDALHRLEAVLERSDDKARLVQTLEYHTRYVATAEEKVSIIRRIADLLHNHLGEVERATGYWEQLVRLAPGDGAALDALAEAYDKLGKAEDLARVLEQQIHRSAGDGAAQASYLRRLAHLAAGVLEQPARAQRAWEELLKVLPSDRQGLEALSSIYQAKGDWRTLVAILERRIPLAEDPAVAISLALERARVLEEDLRNPDEAMRALDQIITELDPKNVEAHDRLRQVAEAKGDWPRVVTTAERQLFLTEDAGERAARALEIGMLWRDKLQDPPRAMTAFERVIELDPNNAEALYALAPLYAMSGDSERLVFTDERLLQQAEQASERRRLMFEIAETQETALGEPRLAFEWYRRAYQESPDDETLKRLEAVAEANGLWEDLIQVYAGERARSTDPTEQVEVALKVAGLCEKRLRNPARAFVVLRDALASEPAGERLLPELERLAGETGEWAGLLDVYARVARGRPTIDERVDLLRRRASVREERQGDVSGALDEYLRSFALRPDGDETQREILRLAERTSRWEDALGVQAQLFARAGDGDAKVEVAKRAAALVEEKVKDRVRAFRAYLNAFRLAPEDAGIVANLWRLAELIGKYEEKTPPPLPATMTVPTAVAAAVAAVDDKAVRVSAERTMALNLSELEDVRDVTARFPPVPVPAIPGMPGMTSPTSPPIAEQADGKPTQPVSAEQVMEEVAASGAEAGDDEVTAGDGMKAAMDAAAAAAADQPAASFGGPGTATTPLDDEDVEEVTDDSVVEEVEVAAESHPAPPLPLGVGTPGPVLVRPSAARPQFHTPWEELAQAYERLPANDNATRHRYLKRIAEVWERGAKDVDRALDALERAFLLETEDDEVRENLRRLAASESRWDQICDIYLRAVETAPREQAVALQHEVAGFREQLDQMDLAEEQYRSILMIQPEDTTALGRLEQIFRNAERWDDLTGILEKRTGGVVEALPPGAERRRKTFELAELYEKRLERPYEAIDTLERYVAAADEDERGFDHPEVIREAGQAYEALARLYSRVGMWHKAVAALQHEIDHAPDGKTARDLRWRLAQIQEREMGADSVAVEAYEAILSAMPEDAEALAALDRLHQSHGRFEPLQDILRRRAELATGEARIELIRRRAKILEEKLGNPDAAASCLRSLGPDLLADDEASAALLRNLRSAGLAHEALRVITQRMELVAKGSDDNATVRRKLVALHLELASLKSGQLGDAAGARVAVEGALAIEPEDADALAALAKMHLVDNDFAAYAEARMRQARALSGRPADAAAALLEAGAVYRDQLANPAEARVCFERAVAVHPANPDALRALAALMAAEGHPEEARALYERQLEVVDTPTAKAQVLTDLARTLWEKPGDAPQAIARLDEALEVAPDYLPAVLTMADIYYKEQQWELAERRLLQALRRLRGQPDQTAKLYHRLAEVYEKLGRLDEGHKQLMEADLTVPGQLLIRIALGENRFLARKWRDAVAHLDGIADHPDAAQYPDEVASGLARGAQAEMKLKHPERAVAMYQAALRLSPDHRPSLRAMADLALERGEKREAAQYLRKVAESSGDRAERAKLFEQLGDLYQGLDEHEPARVAYESAVAMLTQPDESHIPLMEKALGLEQAAGAWSEATETALRISDIVTNPRERSLRRREAAAMLVEQGDVARASKILEQALADNPLDEEILLRVSDAYEKAGRLGELEVLLARSLNELRTLPERPAARARRADLWEKLGSLRKETFPAAAVEAYERAVEADPERVGARLALTALYGESPENAEAALRNNRLLVRADITRSEPLRALAATYDAQGRVDWARCCYELLDLFGLADTRDRAFLEAHPAPVLKPEDPYTGTIEENDRGRWLAHPEARVMSEVFASIWEGIPGLGKTTLEGLGVSAQDKVSPISELDIGKLYGQIGKALGNKRTNLYINWDPNFQGVELVAAPPPAVVIDQGLGTGDESVDIRFLLGRALELTRPEYILAATVAPREFAQLFASVLKAFHPRHARWRAGEKSAEQAAKVKKALPYKVSKRLVELFQENDATPFSSVRWRQVVHETGNRAGLLMCGDLKVAARIVLGETVPTLVRSEVTPEVLREHARTKGPLRELLRYAISEEYFNLRESLGTSVSKAAAA
jgi:golgin subfamily B member 1